MSKLNKNSPLVTSGRKAGLEALETRNLVCERLGAAFHTTIALYKATLTAKEQETGKGIFTLAIELGKVPGSTYEQAACFIAAWVELSRERLKEKHHHSAA